MTENFEYFHKIAFDMMNDANIFDIQSKIENVSEVLIQNK